MITQHKITYTHTSSTAFFRIPSKSAKNHFLTITEMVHVLQVFPVFNSNMYDTILLMARMNCNIQQWWQSVCWK